MSDLTLEDEIKDINDTWLEKMFELQILLDNEHYGAAKIYLNKLIAIRVALNVGAVLINERSTMEKL